MRTYKIIIKLTTNKKIPIQRLDTECDTLREEFYQTEIDVDRVSVYWEEENGK